VEQNTTAEHSHLRPIVDADPIVYRAGFAADSQIKKEYKEQLGEERPIEKEEYLEALASVNYEGIALYNADQMVEGILARFKGEPTTYLTGSGNFREHVATILPYQGTRDPTHKPKYFKEIKHRLIDKWGARVVDGCEADDAVATEQWADKSRGTFICTIDKDLDQAPGWNYNYVKEILYDVSVADANRFFFWQMLNGDTSDNIPGIKGVGPKTIAKLFDGVDDLNQIRSIVQHEYAKQYGTDWERAYHEVGTLLWMVRVEGKGCPFL
jgi:hypothetical protein